MIEKFENITSKEKGDELEKFREEFKKLKEENLNKKERGETYNPHFDNLDPNLLGEEGLFFWKELKEANSEEALNNLEKDFSEYREKISGETVQKLANQGLEEEALQKAFYGDPKINFIGFFGNELFRKQVPFIKAQLQRFKKQR